MLKGTGMNNGDKYEVPDLSFITMKLQENPKIEGLLQHLKRTIILRIIILGKENTLLMVNKNDSPGGVLLSSRL